jgi:hypothetical protein
MNRLISLQLNHLPLGCIDGLFQPTALADRGFCLSPARAGSHKAVNAALGLCPRRCAGAKSLSANASIHLIQRRCLQSRHTTV